MVTNKNLEQSAAAFHFWTFIFVQFSKIKILCPKPQIRVVLIYYIKLLKETLEGLLIYYIKLLKDPFGKTHLERPIRKSFWI
jgi:hypothetical protein